MKPDLNLLLADDDSDDRAFFARALQSVAPEAGLMLFADGKQVIDYLVRIGDNHLPRAIILDYNMPYLCAPDVLDWLNGRPWFDNIRKFVWSTSASDTFIDTCRAKGSIDYYRKPESEHQLRILVSKIVDACR